MFDVIRFIGEILHIESKRMHGGDWLVIGWNLFHEISPISAAEGFKGEGVEWTSAVDLYADLLGKLIEDGLELNTIIVKAVLQAG